MRTSPRALLVAGVLFSLLALLATQPWPAQVAGAFVSLPFAPLTVPEGATARVDLPVPLDPQGQHLLEVVNQTRWANGQVPPLKWNANLKQAALKHSRSMAQDDFFGHKGSDLSSPWDRIDAAGYENWYVLAENIAAGYQSAEDVVQAWLESPQHRENLLNPELHEAGIGYFYEPNDQYPGTTWGYDHYWTLDMGSRWDAYPLIIANEAFSTTSPSVTLYLYGVDWAVEMCLSNDGVNWSTWMPYEPTLEWELAPREGASTVYGQIRNAQGDIMQAEDDIFWVEPQAPVIRPKAAVFVLQQGATTSQPQQYRIQITDPSGGGRNWHATWNASWLRLRTGGEALPNSICLVLTEPARQLTPGIYTATVNFKGGDVEINLPVRLLVFSEVYEAFMPALRR